MLVRSQDKTQIVPMCELYISTRQKGYCISTNRGNDLGIYSTKEKAIKVLDMIQNRLVKEKGNLLHAIYQEPNGKTEYNMIFQMPQDDEVK